MSEKKKLKSKRIDIKDNEITHFKVSLDLHYDKSINKLLMIFIIRNAKIQIKYLN